MLGQLQYAITDILARPNLGSISWDIVANIR